MRSVLRSFDVRRWFAGPRLPETPYERAVKALELGEYESALREAEAALASATEETARADALNKRGVALMGLTRRDEALAAFCDALERCESHAPALVNIGNLLLEDGDVEDAIDHYQAALRSDPGYPLAYRNLSIACKRLGRRGEAVRYLRVADRLESRRPLGRA
jgi:tetratricopeptide (TPR) repeat protein